MAICDLNAMNREDLLSTLQNFISIILTIDEKIKAINQLEAKIDQAKKEEEAMDKFFTSKEKKAFWILTIIGALISFNVTTFWGTVLIIIPLLMIILTIVLIAIEHIDGSSFQSERIEIKSEIQKYHKANVEPLEKSLSESEENLEQYMRSEEVTQAINSTGEEYFDYYIISNLIDYISSHRADNYKEAINLYEEIKHRERVEEMQLSALKAAEDAAESARRQADSLSQIQKDTHSAVRTQQVNAVINYATYRNIKKAQKK